ncbi:hypothetical protein BMS3Abin03_01794 [bacterium BMS3Abin03]|nr:hypothetical protein BMS3Abin03_01794 [bacterium BMS3Abin03]
MKRINFYLIVLLFLSSCTFELDNPDLSTESLIISLNKSSYQKDEIITLTIENSSNKDLILYNCGLQPGFDIEKKIGNSWVVPYILECEGIGEPTEIKQSSILIKTLNLPIYLNQLGNVEGSYRLRLWLATKDEWNTRNYLDDSLRTTKRFNVTE